MQAVAGATAMHGMPPATLYTCAETLFEALSSDVTVDIMLASWIPPDRAVLELCRRIRTPASSACPFLPIIVICQQATRENVLAAREAGVDEFLTSPFSPKAFADRIRAILFNRRGFVQVSGYFGPDRRRGAMAEMLGVERRAGNSTLIDPRTGAVYID